MESNKTHFSSIILGRTPVVLNDRVVFAKHYGFHDNVETDFVYQMELKKAREMGIDSTEERSSFLMLEGLWDEEKDIEIVRLQTSIEQSKKSKKTIFVPSQKEEFNNRIKDLSHQLLELKNAKAELMGKTAEILAKQESENFFILNTIFTDPDLQNLLHSPEEQDDISDQQLSNIVIAYNESFDFLVSGGIKQVALGNEAQTLISIAENAYYFYGKPVSQLTFFQSELFVYAKNYSMMLNYEVAPPASVIDDPDKLEDWYDAATHSKKWTKPDGEGSSSIFGTADDVKQVSGDVYDMDSEIKKASKDGIVDMLTLAKMQGKKV